MILYKHLVRVLRSRRHVSKLRVHSIGPGSDGNSGSDVVMGSEDFSNNASDFSDIYLRDNKIFKASNEIEVYTIYVHLSSVDSLAHSLICPHNVFASHLKLVPGFVNISQVALFLGSTRKILLKNFFLYFFHID